MDVTEIVDYELARIEKVAPADAENADLRALALSHVIEIWAYVWTAYDWGFKRKSGTVTVLINTCSIALPSDFSDFGVYGSVRRASDGCLLADKQHDPQYVSELQRLSTDRGEADCFAVYGTAATTPFGPLLQTRYVSAATALNLWYSMVPPTLDESTNVDNLNFIPAQFHYPVLIPGLRALGAYAHGDARKQDFAMDPAFVAAMARMAGALLKTTRRRQPPGFFDREYR
jgi:hypothetical protein